MLFVTLVKFRRKLTKADTDKTNSIIKGNPQVKVLSIYWTFGRYDAVLTAEAPDEKTYLKFITQFQDYLSTETMLGVPREEAVKMLQ